MGIKLAQILYKDSANKGKKSDGESRHDHSKIKHDEADLNPFGPKSAGKG